MRLRKWQRQIIYGALSPGVRQGLVTIPRGNGKSTLCALLAVYFLFDGTEGAQVIIVAASERQAQIIFNMARRIIELSPELLDRVQIHRDRIVYPAHDGVLMSLPALPESLQGWDPTFCVVDELHVVNEDTWDAMTLAAGKRERSLVLAISTAAEDKDSVMWKLVEHGRSEDDPAFFYQEHAAPDGCDHEDPKMWALANPALGDFLHTDALHANLRTTREPVFRRYRLNQWVGQVGSWLPWGAWDELTADRLIDPHEPVVLAFDGSITDDSTAIVGCTVAKPHHIFAIRMWEKDEEGWRVPRAEVDAAVDRAFASYNVAELACDPWHWQSEIQRWAERHPNVIEFPTNNNSRMAPATDLLRTSVIEKTVTHDGNEQVARHVRNAVVKNTALGDIIVKDRRGSPRKIDGAVTAIVSHARASWHASRPARPRRRVVVL